MLQLSGAPFPPNGFLGDSAYRMAEVVRMAETWTFPDLAYEHLHAFNPPLVPWLTARAAGLLDLAPNEAVKLLTVATAGVVVVAGGLAWRLVTDRGTAVVLGLAPLVWSEWYNSAAWLATVLVVPWWLWLLRTCRPPVVLAPETPAQAGRSGRQNGGALSGLVGGRGAGGAWPGACW